MRVISIKKFLTESKNIGRSAVFWNAFSAVMNSFQTMVLLIILTRYGTMEDSSIFVMAYAVGNLMLNIGKYGIRQFQVTDVHEKYSFYEYIHARKISTTAMLVMAIVYVAYNCLFHDYSVKKSIVVLMICILKAIEAYEDVYHGRMQQKGRLDIAGKILGIRLFLFVFGFAIAFMITRNLLFTVLINVTISFMIAVVLNRIALRTLKYSIDVSNTTKYFLILKECFPLCACMCLNMYVANAPKYIIDTVVSEEVQTCFNIVFMPVFIIALLANFIFQPCLKGLGELWAKKNYSKFTKNICVLGIVVIIACAVITTVGTWIGDDILGFIYKVDLQGYTKILMIFMIAGGVIALQNLLIIAITVIRYQKYMIYGYILTALGLLISGTRVLTVYGITGLAIFFLIMMIVLLLYNIGLLSIGLYKNKKVEGYV